MYSPPFFLFNAHLETIYPALLRRVNIAPYKRERITTPDNDFLDLDWLTQHSTKLVIISHGLEGNSQRPYVKGMAKALFSNGYDVLAWNFRGCSEEMNRQLRFYHSGATEDLETVVQHALTTKRYTELYLVGFSLGGNLTLKYLGEKTPHPSIKKAATFSVPVDLKSSCEKISLPMNRIYSRRFVNSLKTKIIRKAAIMPGLDLSCLDKIRSLQEFDDAYTAPLHGFKNALTYYTACSALNFLNTISIPTLMINTQNDPFLSKQCLAAEEFKDHPNLVFEITAKGGHVGFAQINKNGLYWSEFRALGWFKE
jgi:predicted alpha/beta-fold hydrolase